MKCKCDVIRDLMPLCADDSAAAGSREMVFEHLAECRECENYYQKLVREVGPDAAPDGRGDGNTQRPDTAMGNDSNQEGDTAEYMAIAKRYRNRNRRRRAAVSILAAAVFLVLLNYALGFRLTARAAAERSGRLNQTSKVIGTYDWGDVQFFFYESDANYDTIASVRHLNGWRSDDFYFVWPKYPADKGGIIVTSGLYFFRDDQGILILPVLCRDEEITRITVTAFGQTKSADLETGVLSVLAFENNDIAKEDDTVGYAYDRNGNIRYELKWDESLVRWVWTQ